MTTWLGDDASIAAGDCSMATALQLVDQHQLNAFLLPNPVRQVLCGPFTGAGSEAIAITIGAPTCWGIQRWAVFNFIGAAWELVLDQSEFVFPPLVAVGSTIRVTTPVFRPGDPRCIPSGGSHARIWHWNGTSFTAGPWTQVTPGAAATFAEFFSPSRNIGCDIGDHSGRPAFGVFCRSESRELSVTLSPNGRLYICHGSRPDHPCIGHPAKSSPSLAYGKQITVGRFRCLSRRSRVTCIVIRSGKGFLIRPRRRTSRLTLNFRPAPNYAKRQ